MYRVFVFVGLAAAGMAGLAGAAEGRSPADAAFNSRRMYAPEIAALEKTSFTPEQVRALAGTTGFKVYPGNPILSPGPAGTWDGGAIGSANVLVVDGLFHMYYEAWGVMHKDVRAEDYYSLQIGHAVSLDGVHWVKDPANPVVPRGTDDQWDARGTWDPFVIYEDGLFKMWYGGGEGMDCNWAYAESKDGRHFVKRGKICSLNQVEDDHVVHDEAKGRYYMYYWNRQYEPHGLFRAESPDETHFDFARASNIHIEGHDPDRQFKFTYVTKEGDTWYMLYADFVRPNCPDSLTRLAASPDGLHWKSVNKRLFAGHDADVVRVDDSLYLAYFGPQGYFDQKDCDVRLAVYRGTLRDLENGDTEKSGAENN